jgi:ribosome-associated protein
MKLRSIDILTSLSIPENELDFQFTRSGGPGGQNVNKVSTRVELLFNVADSSALSPPQKERILSTLGSRIDNQGVLHVASQESRSQWKNREQVVTKFAGLLRNALAVGKKRVATRASRSSKEVRFKEKKVQAVKKKLRGRVNPADM